MRADPAAVWRAWTDPALKRAWFVDADEPGWETLEYVCDTAIGGVERGRFRHGTVVHENRTICLDRAEGRRLVFAYTMALDGVPQSASLTTVEIAPDGTGTRLVLTEQAAFFHGPDGAGLRRDGWGWLLDRLEAQLALAA